MVISQPAVLCLQASVAHTAARASASGSRFGRLLPAQVRNLPLATVRGGRTTGSDAEIALSLRAALRPER